MKTILLLLIITITSVGSAQTSILVPPEWKVTLHIVDEVGQPVGDAQVEVGYIKPNSDDRSSSIDGRTDTNGLFVASGHSYSRLYLNVKKEDY
jgi:hypothetical protein